VATTTLTTADGIHLAARVLRATAPNGSVVLAHGFTASSAHPEVAAIAAALLDAGYDVVTYDARGHGDSTGRCTLGDLERHDVAAARAAVDPGSGPVVLVGISMGAIAVLRHAADPRPVGPGAPPLAGVVTVSAPARWKLPRTGRGVASAAITSTALGRAFAARRLGVRIAPTRHRPEPPIELVSRVSVPVAVIHGIDDPFLPSSNARALHDAAAAPRRLDLVPGAWHAHGADTPAAVVHAVDWALGAHALRR
jgi:alpha-beta hydrolase superfamily lysophospholipase